MRREGSLSSAPDAEHAAGDKDLHKTRISEARREQNRRAQRAFRERQRTAKKQILISTHPRRLAPRLSLPEKVEGTRPDSDSQICGSFSSSFSTPGSENAEGGISQQTESNSSSCVLDAATSKEAPAPFSFSSPQTLLPDHDSLVPKPRTPYSDLLDLTRPDGGGSRPLRPALWPHGVTVTLAACLFNARTLGIDIDRILDPNYMSPFYKPSWKSVLDDAEHSDNDHHGLDTFSDSQQSAVFDGPLRPCLAQIIFPHHACIDLLPLPRLRETAVMLIACAAQQQQRERARRGDDDVGSDATLSPLPSPSLSASPAPGRVHQLKKDIYLSQGIRFRGSGELIGDEYVLDDGRGRRHCGNPWEGASWAVAPWFARKWKSLVDTPEVRLQTQQVN